MPIDPRSLHMILPLILAKRVSSFPRPTLRPGFTRVPRWLTMIVPPGTIWPPNALKPRRCAFESRPLRELPKPFLCAIKALSCQPSAFSGNSICQLLLFLLPCTLFCGAPFGSCSFFLCGRFSGLCFSFRRCFRFRCRLFWLHFSLRKFRRSELL